MKLIPASMAAWRIPAHSSWSVLPTAPNIIGTIKWWTPREHHLTDGAGSIPAAAEPEPPNLRGQGGLNTHRHSTAHIRRIKRDDVIARGSRQALSSLGFSMPDQQQEQAFRGKARHKHDHAEPSRAWCAVERVANCLPPVCRAWGRRKYSEIM